MAGAGPKAMVCSCSNLTGIIGRPRRQQREKRYQKKKGANQDNKRHEVSCMQKCSPASHTWYGLSFVGSGFS